MHRFARLFGTLAAILLVLVAIPGASAGTPVDPDSLTPPPPPGSTCVGVGPSTVICHTHVSFPVWQEAIFDIACGTVYQTSTDDREGIRWYEDGLLARRIYRAELDGTWSLTPDATGPTIDFQGNWNSSSIWTVPGDDETLVETLHGLHFHGIASGLGSALHLSGLIEADLTVHGLNTIDEPLGQISPAAIAAMESVLCV